jgi:EAL domain-containing protein (putative c-di-GMP-specific phosphodiesterase class I)
MSIEPRPLGGVGVVDAPRTYTDVDAVIDDRAIWTAFQPIVRLDSREVVGYEALSRGPAGTRWQDPLEMFDAARAIGRAGELDWICRAKAYRHALAAGLHPDLALFVNAEPTTLREPCPPDLAPVRVAAEDRLRVVTELTERGMAVDPAALLAAAAGHRSAAHGVALDDVGADPASLAMMPFVHPDVVKLDMRLLHRPETPGAARVVNAVIAHAERTGAAIIAEGIERESHIAQALAMGATLGQGWLFGHPAPLRRGLTPPRRPLALLGPPAVDHPSRRAATPYQIVTAHRAASRTAKRMLLASSRYLESKAADGGEPPVLLVALQDARNFTPRTARRYAALATAAPFVGAFGADVEKVPAPGVRGAALHAGDPLLGEWAVIVVGPYFSAALVARDLGDGGADRYRRFDYALTYDRPLVLEAARALLRRLGPAADQPPPI